MIRDAVSLDLKVEKGNHELRNVAKRWKRHLEAMERKAAGPTP